jgi:hypothetical protein
MSQPMAFADVLDAAEQLDPDAQAELVAVLSRRLAERGRPRVAATVAQNSAFDSGWMNALLRGVGSVLEFFPPPERFNVWRLDQEVSARS